MSENETIGNYGYTVDIKSMPEEVRGIARVIPTRFRARIGSQHEAFGDAYMTKEQANKAVPPAVDNFRRQYGKPGKIYFGKVVGEGSKKG